jgi:Cu(I)/Ag(I) efflux system membrane fusion protein
MTARPLLFFVPVAALVALAPACGPRANKPARKYTCSMHPQIVRDEPGDCPICGMRLTPIDETRPSSPATAPHRHQSPPDPEEPRPPSATGQQWTCPMHPEIRRDAPGSCPICKMDLVPVEKTPAAPAPTTTPPPLHLDAERAKLLGLRATPAVRAPLAGTLRTTGRVAFDERRVHKVTPRFEGYVEKLYADFTGKAVRKGEPLVALYAPEVFATQEELLLAERGRQALAEAGLPQAAKAARERLLRWGLAEEDVAAIEQRGEPQRAVVLRAPISGVVTQKSVVAGARVGPDAPLFEIADLSQVWILADVYEADLPRVSVGQKATVRLSYWPGRAWVGRVSYLFPTLDEKSRTARVRIVVDNPKGELKPEMFADVELESASRRALVVPDDAVIDAGTHAVVFVVRPGRAGAGAGDRELAPREVELGARAGGKVEIRRGLAEGDEVALGASFLLDSETRLRSAVTGGHAVHGAHGASDGGSR